MKFRTKDELNTLTIDEDASLRESIKKMDAAHRGIICAVNDEGSLQGILTDGDFRRLVLEGVGMENPVKDFLINNPILIEKSRATNANIKNSLKKNSIVNLPIVENNKLIDLALESDFFRDSSNAMENNIQLNTSAVIMAGGKGTRLDPFTRILPKPLIPIGEDPIIEIIMDEFGHFGIDEFYISVNHKARMIKAYFDDRKDKFNIHFIDESEPLGTAGALKFLEGDIKQSFFISNCDIIIRDNYSKIFEFHKMGNYQLSLVASIQHHTVPYGVCEIENGGALKEIREKPEYDYLVNTGFYIMEPDVLKFIPNDKYFDMTDLISKLKKENLKIGVYPVSQESWLDVGQWDSFNKTIDTL